MGQGLKELEALCVQLLSPNTKIRNEAENQYNTWISKSIETFLSTTRQVLRYSTNDEVKAVLLVLFRILMQEDDNYNKIIQNHTTNQNLQLICSEFIVALSNETSCLVRQQLDETVVAIAVRLLAAEKWREILPFLSLNFKQQTSAKKMSMLSILSEVMLRCGRHLDFLSSYSAELLSLLNSALDDSDINVKMTAIRCTETFAKSLLFISLNDYMPSLMPNFFREAIVILKSGNGNNILDVLYVLYFLARQQDDVFQEVSDEFISTLVNTLHTIQDLNARVLVYDVVIHLLESNEDLESTVPSFYLWATQLGIELISNLPDVSLDQWTENDEENDYSMEDHVYGEVILDRIAESIGSSESKLQIMNIISKLFIHSDWKKRYAGIIAIGVIVEGCVKLLESFLPIIIKGLVAATTDPEPLVKWAAVHTIALFCDVYSPNLQLIHGDEVMPAMLSLMNKYENKSFNKRVAGHTCNSIINFHHEDVPNYIILRYFPQIVSVGFTLINLHIPEALTMLESFTEPHFDVAPATDLVMALMRTIYANIEDKRKTQIPLSFTERNLFGRTTRCAAALALLVQNRAYGREIMDLVITFSFTPGDTITDFLIGTINYVADLLQEEFSQYLPFVVSAYTSLLNTNPETVIVVPVGSKMAMEAGYDYTSVSSAVIVGMSVDDDPAILVKKLTIASFVLLAKDLKRHLQPFVDQIVDAVIPWFMYYISDSVRGDVCECVVMLMKCAKKDQKHSGANILGTLNKIYHSLMEVIVENFMGESLKLISCFMDAMGECIDIYGGPCMDETQQTTIFEFTKRIFAMYFQLNTADFEETREEAQECLISAATFLGAVVKIHSESMLPRVSSIYPTILSLLSSEVAEESLAGLCLIDDIVDGAGKAASSIFPIVMPFFTKHMKSEDANVRQAAVFGVGIFAKYGKEEFWSYVPESLKILLEVCHAPDAREHENATVNAISALGWFLATYNDPQLDKYYPEFLYLLPTMADEVESEIIYNHLCDFLEDSTKCKLVLGANNERLPKIFSILDSAVNSDEVHLRKRVKERMTGVVAYLRNTHNKT